MEHTYHKKIEEIIQTLKSYGIPFRQLPKFYSSLYAWKNGVKSFDYTFPEGITTQDEFTKNLNKIDYWISECKQNIMDLRKDLSNERLSETQKLCTSGTLQQKIIALGEFQTKKIEHSLLKIKTMDEIYSKIEPFLIDLQKVSEKLNSLKNIENVEPISETVLLKEITSFQTAENMEKIMEES